MECGPPIVIGQPSEGGCSRRVKPPAPIPLQPPCCQGPIPTFYKPRPCCRQPCHTPPSCWCHPCWAPPHCCRPGAYNPRYPPPRVCPPPCCCQPCKVPPRCMPPPCQKCRRPCCAKPVMMPIPAWQPQPSCGMSGMCCPCGGPCPSPTVTATCNSPCSC